MSEMSEQEFNEYLTRAVECHLAYFKTGHTWPQSLLHTAEQYPLLTTTQLQSALVCRNKQIAQDKKKVQEEKKMKQNEKKSEKSLIEKAFEVLTSNECPVGEYGYRKVSKDADMFMRHIGAEKLVDEWGNLIVLFNSPACSEEPAMFWALRLLNGTGKSGIATLVRSGWIIAEHYETNWPFQWNVGTAQSDEKYCVLEPGCKMVFLTKKELATLAKTHLK